jgi:hypothetical protein
MNYKRTIVETVGSVPLRVEVATEAEYRWFDEQMGQHHYLGAGRPVGDYLRQIVRVLDRPVALLVWGPACYALKDRDLWISWSAPQRVERLKLIVQNRRFLLLSAPGQAPNLASQTLGAVLRALPEDCRPGLGSTPTGLLPLKAPEMDSLHAVFARAKDPRDTNTHYRIGAVLTIVAMALLAGRREIAEIVRFAQTLSHPQRRRLVLPLKKGTRAFFKVPGYGVFYQVLTRLDPEPFARLLNDWLISRAGTLPTALALDGKMIRDHIGLLTLAQHEDGAPQAVAIYDQKEGTERCELTAATALLEALPTLEGKLITADPLHCQRKTSRTIVEKGGDYLLRIKGNQPHLLQQAQAFDALANTPFLSTAKLDTAGSIPAASIPSPSNR